MLYADVEIYYFSRDSARCVHVNDYIALKAKSLPSLSFIIKPGVYSLWSGGGYY